MRKTLICCILIAMFFMSGCVVRTYTTEMDRVDQEISGNRGIVMGTPPAVEETEQVKKTRRIYNVEVEVPSAYRVSTYEKTKDKDLYGNRGYVQGDMVPEKEVCVSGEQGEHVSVMRLSGGVDSARIPQIVYSEPSGNTETRTLVSNGKNQQQYYIVQKNDTLQKISEKFFGTTQKWKYIYNVNKHILKSPDRIRPGQKIVIPKD